MSQPPDEPPPEGEGADAGWQAPGPAPLPPQPPPNPYGGDNMSYYRPVDSGGMSRNVQVVLGVVIGLAGGFFLWIVAVIAFAESTRGDAIFFYAAAAPIVVPVPLLIWKATRPWAVGLLMGTAVATIGMSSLCSAMLNSLEGGA